MAVAVILGGQLRIVLQLAFAGDRISGVEAIADATRIGGMDVEVLER
jgi:RNA polymerase sigma-70 factor (ECF subfamily)